MRGEPRGHAAGGGGEPKISGVCEDDFIRMNVREAQQFGLRFKTSRKTAEYERV
jgi:hypothetical protein